MKNRGRGIVTLAVGDNRYLEMAVDMALSVREHETLPVTLVADVVTARLARDLYGPVFASVVVIADRFRFMRAIKYGVADASPYEEALFVDADCWVLGELGPFLNRLQGEVMVFQGEMLTSADDKIHHGFPTRRLMNQLGIERYLKCNSGVLAFRRSQALPLMEEALECYRDQLMPNLRGGFIGDELALGVVGGRHDLGLFGSSWPMSWGSELRVLDPQNPPRPICHLLSPIKREALEWLMAESARRRARVGVPDQGDAHWRWKHRRVVRGAALQKVLRPLLPIARLIGARATRHV